MECLLFKDKGEMISSTTAKSSANQHPPWKLYINPIFVHNPPQLQPQSPKQSSCIRGLASAMAATSRSAKTELENAGAMIMELKAELELERDLKKEAESLMKMMAEEVETERRRRTAAEILCNELANRVLNQTAQIERIGREMEEERRMLRVADVIREERFQMKMEDVKIFYEERPIRLKQRGGDGKTVEERRRWVSEPENPHIKRGINGFVEFPKGRGSNRNVGGNYQLQCQKAQLRILLKQSNVLPKSVVTS